MGKQGWSALLWGKNSIRFLTFTGGVVLHATNVYIVITILPSLMSEMSGEFYYSWVATVFIIASLLGTSLATKYWENRTSQGLYHLWVDFYYWDFYLQHRLNYAIIFNRTLCARVWKRFFTLSILFYDTYRFPSISMVSRIKYYLWNVGNINPVRTSYRWYFHILWSMESIFLEYWSISYNLFACSFSSLTKRNKNCVPTSPLPLAQLLILSLSLLIISIGGAMDTTATKISGIVMGLSLLFVIAKIESSTPHPMLPRNSFSFSSEFFPVYALILIMTIVVYSIELYFPLFLQKLHGQSPLIAGYIASLMSLGWTCGSLLSAGVSTKKFADSLYILLY